MGKLETLLTWFEEQELHFDGICIKSAGHLYSGEALGVYAGQDLAEGTVLVSIPKSAILSRRTTGLSSFLEQHRLGGGLGLVFAVMYEAALGKKSRWYGYMQSLPAREYIPIFWTGAELDLLKGTAAAEIAKADREDTEADFVSEIQPLLEEGRQYFDPGKMTLTAFRSAASWIGSRAFGVDDYHGMSIVPFADIFNHKASIVKLGEGYTLESACLEMQDSSSSEDAADESAFDQNGDSSDHGTSEEACIDRNHGASEEHSRDEMSEAGCGSEGSEDDGRRRPSITATTRGSMLDEALFPEQDLRLQIGICGGSRGNEEVLEIVAACDLKEGQEIFNTFGELGNTELVSKYGFALPDNPFSVVPLKKSAFLDQARRILDSPTFQERVAYLEDQRWLSKQGKCC